MSQLFCELSEAPPGTAAAQTPSQRPALLPSAVPGAATPWRMPRPGREGWFEAAIQLQGFTQGSRDVGWGCLALVNFKLRRSRQDVRGSPCLWELPRIRGAGTGLTILECWFASWATWCNSSDSQSGAGRAPIRLLKVQPHPETPNSA